MAEKKKLSEITVGMLIAQTVYGPKGINLIPEGTTIDEELLDKLQQWDVETVFISEETEDEFIEKQEQETRQVYRKVYDKSLNCIKDILKNAGKNEPIKIEEIQQPVKEVIDKVNENRDVLVQLTRLNKMDNHLLTHSVNVCVYTLVLGRSLNLSSGQLLELGTTALLHDIGMTKIDEKLWNNKNPLDKSSWENIKNHPLLGSARLEKFSNYPASIIDGIKQHHEKLDGSGYPQGLKGSEISYYAAVVGLANVYESLTAYRKYREPVIPYEAIKIILSKGDRHFPGEILRALVANVAIYPIGSFVLLNTGEVAKVIGITPEHPFRPRLKVLFDSERKPQAKVRRIDLKNKQYTTTYITKTMTETEVGDMTENQ